MPKTKQQKKDTIASLTDGFKQAKSVVFANVQGLKVSQADELRRACRQVGVSVLAAKKTLLKKACSDIGLTDVDPTLFAGGVASFFGNDEVAAAKAVNDFSKTHEIVNIFGGILENKFISSLEVKNLACLPSKIELLGKLVGTLQVPISGLATVLNGNLRNLVSVLNNISKVKA